MAFILPSSHHSISDELLSAYLDDALTPDEKARVEHVLHTQPEVQARLEMLRATVSLLGQLEPVPVPRAFVLSEAHVQGEQQREGGGWWRWLLPRLMPAVTAAMAVALMVVVGLDVRTATQPAAQPEVAKAPVAAEAPAVEPEAMALQAQETGSAEAVRAPEALRSQESAAEKVVEVTREVANVVPAEPVEQPAPEIRVAAQDTAAPSPTPKVAPTVVPAPAPTPEAGSQPSTTSQWRRLEQVLGALLLASLGLTWWVRRQFGGR